MNLKFDYSPENLPVARIAYDLALVYAQSKLNQALRNGQDTIFDQFDEIREYGEKEYLARQFYAALGYYTLAEPGTAERLFQEEAGRGPFDGDA